MDDHVQINQALQLVAENSNYTTVHLKGPFTFFVNDTLLIANNTTLEGDSNAELKLVNNANWKVSKPILMEKSLNSQNISIHGFKINGNREGNTNVASGKGYNNLVHLSKCQNISVHDMYLANNHGDGLKTDSCSNITYYNNKIYELGHDGLYASSCSNIEAYNNTIVCRTNSALRLYNSNHAKFYDNTISSRGSGGAGIEIQKYGTPVMDDIEIYNNTIYKTALTGIWVFASGSAYPLSSANVLIHHNRIYDTGTRHSNPIIGGIVSGGFNVLLENNVFDGCYGSGISQKETYSSIPGSGYVLTARNNIITNSRFSSGGGSAYGTYNLLPGTHSFVLQNNCLNNNTGGNYGSVQTSPSDIKVDPQYADQTGKDYHLKSKAGRWNENRSIWETDNISSPCIDAGYIYSDYSKEPENNGNRINIDAYGNTKYASKSGSLNESNGQTSAFFETQLTNNKSDQSGPAINGDIIVWMDSRNESSELYIYDLSSHKEARIPANSSWASNPAIYGSTIVWDDNRNSNCDIYMFNISTFKEIQITANQSWQGNPAIYGDKIIWTDWRNGNADIYMYNSSSSATTQITTNKSDQVECALFGNNIVWQDARNGNWDIYAYDLSASKEIQITTDKENQAFPAIYADQIVWQDARNGQWDIYMYNLSTSATTRISSNASNEVNPAIYGYKITWDDNNAFNSNIQMFDILTSREIQITKNESRQGNSAVYSSIVVWEDGRNRNSDIYMCNISEKPEIKKPAANFSSNVTQGYAPLTVQFTDLSKNATSRNWDFENDGKIDSTVISPVHIYEAAGNYTVNLTAINQNSTNSKLGTITVLRKPIIPVADFSTNVTEGNAPLVVQFTDLSKNSTSRIWDFGDGANSTHQNPVHTYSTAGNYTVTLTAINSDGKDTKTKIINVKAAPQKPTANFSAFPVSGNAPLAVSFTDISKGAPTSWIWNFGDRTTSTNKNQTHTYSQAGKYTVSLTVKNAIGSNTTTKSSYINVTAPLKAPVAAFSGTPISGRVPLKVQFTDKSTGSPNSWAWSFGDGITSATRNASHTYLKAGKYTVRLTVENSAGSNTKSTSGYITVRSR
ncbi:MAG: PKD domain-containing protein [Methanosarcina sp.]